MDRWTVITIDKQSQLTQTDNTYRNYIIKNVKELLIPMHPLPQPLQYFPGYSGLLLQSNTAVGEVVGTFASCYPEKNQTRNTVGNQYFIWKLDSSVLPGMLRRQLYLSKQSSSFFALLRAQHWPAEIIINCQNLYRYRGLCSMLTSSGGKSTL